MREKRRSEYKAVDTATCKSFGFKVDQPEYNQCIVNEQRYRQTQHDIDVNRMKARRAQRQQRYGYWALKAWYVTYSARAFNLRTELADQDPLLDTVFTP